MEAAESEICLVLQMTGVLKKKIWRKWKQQKVKYVIVPEKDNSVSFSNVEVKEESSFEDSYENQTDLHFIRQSVNESMSPMTKTVPHPGTPFVGSELRYQIFGNFLFRFSAKSQVIAQKAKPLLFLKLPWLDGNKAPQKGAGPLLKRTPYHILPRILSKS